MVSVGKKLRQVVPLRGTGNMFSCCIMRLP